MGAGIEKFGDSKFSAALQAAVDHVPTRLGDKMRPDIVGEMFGFQYLILSGYSFF
jgi:hypothetical protein